MGNTITGLTRRLQGRHKRRVVAGLVIAIVVLVGVRNAVAQEEVVSREYTIKAGVIGLLGKCVTWPREAAPTRDEPLLIGLLGKDPFFENGVNQLDREVAAQNAKGAKIGVKRFNSIKDYEPCHILFISSDVGAEGGESSVADRIKAVRQVAGATTVLIIGETNGAASQGAIANLLYDKSTNLIRLELNPDAAARAGFKLSPDLLRLKLVMIVRDPTAKL